ncbi:MAG TPA: hypothetical protein PLZ78_02820 [Spirochaetota bacterium]|nr:hypothetical protein [Spirochaetota bacterium]
MARHKTGHHELSPCPRCGDTPRWYYMPHGPGREGEIGFCVTCACRNLFDAPVFDDLADAAKDWGRRRNDGA